MAQQTATPDTGTDESTDEETVADTLETELSFAVELLESVTESDVADMSDEEIVRVRNELKELDDKTEEVRKDVVDSEIENRIEPGESLYGLSRIQSHNKYITEDDGAVVARAVSQGIDYTEFVNVNASKLSEVAPDLTEIHEAEYTYLR